MNYSYRYDPAASTADNVSRSLEMDGLRIRLAPTAVQLRARATAPQNGHATRVLVPIDPDPDLRLTSL